MLQGRAAQLDVSVEQRHWRPDAPGDISALVRNQIGDARKCVARMTAARRMHISG
jgi:hypothetical protein